MELKPVTRDEMYWAAILDELKALRGDLQRLTPPPKQAAGMVELKEPARKAKPKRKG